MSCLRAVTTLKFLGGKPDALIAGRNVEISNKLTLNRRPGLIPYGTANIPSPTNFFDWQLATTGDIILVVDTETSGGDNNAGANGAVFNYSPTNSGIYVNKAPLSKQTNFIDIVNTLYFGDGVDLYKIVGPNLLTQSNMYGTGAGTNFSIQSPWTEANIFALTGPIPATSTQPLQTGGYADPVGGTAATQLIWGTTGAGAYLQQIVVPNYTPVGSNTFTFSFWMQETGGAQTVTLEIADQSGSIATKVCVLTPTWTKYSVTATMNSGSTEIKVLLTSPTTTNTMVIYGAQLEVGGPATTTQITTNKPQGVYLWGIQAPAGAPTAVASSSVVGSAWAPNHAYSTAILALTSVATGTGVYTGKIVTGASNALVGQYFTIAGFANVSNNGYFVCTGSSLTTLTLANAGTISETPANGATATPTLTLTSVTAAGVYSGTITGGFANAWAGYAFTITGFVNGPNNGTFYCISSTNLEITLLNNKAVAETMSARAQLLGQAITDSNGNLEAANASGTSGSTPPLWNNTIGGTTSDGTQTFIVQTATGTVPSGTSSVAVAFAANVTATDSLIAYVALNKSSSTSCSITDTQSNVWVQIATISSGPFDAYMFWCQSAAAGATTVTATVTGAQGLWLGIQEGLPLTAVDAFASNSANSIGATTAGAFQTGVVTTTQIKEFIVSFSFIVAGNHAASTSTVPTGFAPIVASTSSQTPFSQGKATCQAGFEYAPIKVVANPLWGVTFAAGGSREMGITASFETLGTVTYLDWTNYGPIGLTAIIGYQYYYAFMNSYTGHVSNVSPISASTGPIAGQSVSLSGAGMQITPSGPYGQDPQVGTIALFRNTDGGPYFYQVTTFANPGTTTSAGIWTYNDTTPSTSLNTAIFAPIGLLNSLPPAGLVNMEYFAGRMWGTVGNQLYYNTSADNAALLGITQNGVPSESWAPANYIPFNAPNVRTVATGGGLLNSTTRDTWIVEGQNLLAGGFNPRKILANHGVRSWNAVDVDGSTIHIYTSDRQCLIISPNSGSVEVGYPIGDTLQKTFAPNNVFFVRHVDGSEDNAVFLADGSTGWYRLNPNQQGASMSGEQTPVWSPKADFTASIGGISAIASIETSAGVIQLLVGLPPLSTSGIPQAGPVLVRDLNTFSDDGVPYQWTATIGSILLTTPGKLAELESVTSEFNAANASGASQCTVSVLLDEIAGTFESLPLYVDDPPQLTPSTSVLSNRFYLSQGSNPPICRHVQIQLNGAVTSGLPASSQDELLALTLRGCLVSEQV